MIIGNVILEHIKGCDDLFEVVKGFFYRDENYQIRVTPHWITDGASIPRIFWNILPPIAAEYLEAAVLHDALYKTQILSRKKSDAIFLKAMKDLKVGFIKRYIMYFAVRLFGQFAWYNNKKNGLIKACSVKKLK